MSCRLFYALWPDDAARAALFALQSQLSGGKPVPSANLHLTLAFLGQQSADLLPALRALPARWADFACELQFDTLGYFRRPKIAWAGMRVAPSALIALQKEVVSALETEGIVLPGEHDNFVPHVSLMRDAVAPSIGEIAPVAWRARGVVLVESVPQPGGSQYRILAGEG
jgi:2'-5' RNA ligase